MPLTENVKKLWKQYTDHLLDLGFSLHDGKENDETYVLKNETHSKLYATIRDPLVGCDGVGVAVTSLFFEPAQDKKEMSPSDTLSISVLENMLNYIGVGLIYNRIENTYSINNPNLPLQGNLLDSSRGSPEDDFSQENIDWLKQYTTIVTKIFMEYERIASNLDKNIRDYFKENPVTDAHKALNLSQPQ